MRYFSKIIPKTLGSLKEDVYTNLSKDFCSVKLGFKRKNFPTTLVALNVDLKKLPRTLIGFLKIILSKTWIF